MCKIPDTQVLREIGDEGPKIKQGSETQTPCLQPAGPSLEFTAGRVLEEGSSKIILYSLNWRLRPRESGLNEMSRGDFQS